jgi:hypothetical protein
MKPLPRTQYKHTGTATKDIQMGVNAAGLVHIMDILVKQYSDLALAVIREYSTNAYDANVEAGSTDPVKVTLPTAFNPTFIVEDSGTGMSIDDIEKVYSQFGYSTKQHSNDFNGMLGIGCKSALGYTDQFTVDTVKNGWRTIAVMTKEANGAGVIKVLSHDKTSDGNGTRISVPAHDIDTFNLKARKFFDYWTSPVLVNGEDGRDRDRWIEAADGVFYRVWQGYYGGSIRLVMANVTYEVRSEYCHDGLDLLIDVPTGSVEFTPSRESLMYTEHTNAFLEANAKNWASTAIAHITKHIADCDNKWDAWLEARKFNRLIRNTTVYYDGEKIPNHYVLDSEDGWVYRPTAKRYRVSSTAGIGDSETWAKITNYPNDGLSTSQANKIGAWLKHNGHDVTHVYVVPPSGGNEWTEGMPEFDYATIKAWRAPKSSSGLRSTLGLKVVGTWDDTKPMTEKQIDDLSDYHVVCPVTVKGDTYAKRTYFQSLKAAMRTTGDDYVMIGRNRFDKYLRENDEAVMLNEYLSEKIAEVVNGMSEEDKFLYVHGPLNTNVPNDTDCEFVNKLAKLTNSAELINLKKQLSQLQNALRYSQLKIDTAPEIKSEWAERLETDYPLLKHIDYHAPEDVVRDYINLVAAS